MTCRFCGARLPAGASFCGECGRSVVDGGSPPPSPWAPEIAFSSEPDAGPAPRPAVGADGERSCPQCAAPIGADDVFCGECGFVVRSSHLSAPPGAVGDARDTSQIGPVDVAEPEPEPEPDPEVPGRSPRFLSTAPDPFPWGKDTRPPPIDLEATRAVAGVPAQERFVLQFSTGESVIVTGSGLVGRNPASQPGEFVDQLVTVFDAGKSVSKTHLEFGQENARFWVSDRYSTNGSTLRQPDAEPRRCEPGRRYFIARGTRVDIGEQFFVVS